MPDSKAESNADAPREIDPEAIARAENNPPGETSLFRPEAIAHLQEKPEGDVLDIRDIPFGGFALSGLAFLVLLFGFLYFTHYAQTERVVGVLLPESGLTAIHAPRVGTVAQLHIKEGQVVTAGAPLMDIRTEQELQGGQPMAQTLIAELEISLQRAQIQREKRATLDNVERVRLQQEINGVQLQISQLETRMKHQGQLVTLQEKQVERLHELQQKGMYAEAAVDEKRIQSQAAQAQHAALSEQHTQLAAHLAALRTDKIMLPTQQQYRLNAIEEQIAVLRRQLVQQRATLGYTISAPVSGRIATLRAGEGEMVSLQKAVLTIMPKQSKLVAELYAPTSTRGNLHIGQEVALQYGAYPPREYGAQQGKVIAISATTIQPNEIGLPVMQRQLQPVYRVKVALEAQSITAPNGETKPLRPGMSLDAELVSERRRIISWLAGPLLDAKDRS